MPQQQPGMFGFTAPQPPLFVRPLPPAPAEASSQPAAIVPPVFPFSGFVDLPPAADTSFVEVAEELLPHGTIAAAVSAQDEAAAAAVHRRHSQRQRSLRSEQLPLEPRFGQRREQQQQQAQPSRLHIHGADGKHGVGRAYEVTSLPRLPPPPVLLETKMPNYQLDRFSYLPSRLISHVAPLLGRGEQLLPSNFRQQLKHKKEARTLPVATGRRSELTMPTVSGEPFVVPFNLLEAASRTASLTPRSLTILRRATPFLAHEYAEFYAQYVNLHPNPPPVRRVLKADAVMPIPTS